MATTRPVIQWILAVASIVLFLHFDLAAAQSPIDNNQGLRESHRQPSEHVPRRLVMGRRKRIKSKKSKTSMSSKSSSKSKSSKSSKSCSSTRFETNFFVDFRGSWITLSQDDLDHFATTFQQIYNDMLEERHCEGYRRIQRVSARIDTGFLPGYDSAFRLLYTVYGVCLGCSSQDSTLFQYSRRQLTQSEVRSPGTRGLGRNRQDSRSSSSSSESAPMPAQPRVFRAYARAIQEAIDLGILPSEIQGLEALMEVQPVECDPQVTEFEALVDIDFTAMVPEDLVPTSDLDRCRQGFALTYNELSVCDSQFRKVQSVNLQSRRALQDTGRGLLDNNATMAPFLFPLAVTWVVVGNCRGCEANIDLFDDVSSIRRVLNIRATDSRVDYNPCYCPIQQENLPLTEDEFQAGYQRFVDEERELGTVQDIVGVANVQEAS